MKEYIEYTIKYVGNKEPYTVEEYTDFQHELRHTNKEEIDRLFWASYVQHNLNGEFNIDDVGIYNIEAEINEAQQELEA